MSFMLHQKQNYIFLFSSFNVQSHTENIEAHSANDTKFIDAILDLNRSYKSLTYKHSCSTHW